MASSTASGKSSPRVQKLFPGLYAAVRLLQSQGNHLAQVWRFGVVQRTVVSVAFSSGQQLQQFVEEIVFQQGALKQQQRAVAVAQDVFALVRCGEGVHRYQ